MKYYLYIDESGDHGLARPNPDFPVFLLCGVIVAADEYENIRQSFNQIKHALWGNKEVIIIERRGKKEDKKLEEHFQRLLARGTGYVLPQRLKEYQLKITFKSKKENINGLQLADLIAYPIARYVIEPNRANPAFEQIESKIYTKNRRRYGLKIFP